MQGSGTAPSVEHGKDEASECHCCMAAYNSEIDVPVNMGLEDALQYASEHLDNIPPGEIEYVPDSDELDEDNCDFEK